jgi:hypothetical protein
MFMQVHEEDPEGSSILATIGGQRNSVVCGRTLLSAAVDFDAVVRTTLFSLIRHVREEMKETEKQLQRGGQECPHRTPASL